MTNITLLELIDKNSSAIFTLLGTVIGFIGNYFLQKSNQKFEITKEIAREYYKNKKNILTKTLQLISDYETKIKTLFDLIEDENGIPIKELKEEDIHSQYFLLIFEYLHSNRFYLEEETIKKLDKLIDIYHSYKLDMKIVLSEYANEDIEPAISNLKQKLLKNSKVLFNELKEQIKFDEIKNFRTKLENK